MKTNEQEQASQKTTKKQKKGRGKLFWLATGALIGGAGVYLYTNKDARKTVIATGKKMYTSTTDFVAGIFKTKKVTPCDEQPESILVIRETVVPEVKTPRFEQPRPRHRRNESNWTKPMNEGVNKSLNVNK